MLRSSFERNSPSGLITHFVPQLKQHHQSHSINQTAIQNIWRQRNHIPVYQWLKNVATGVSAALVLSVFGLYFKTGSKQIYLDRQLLNPKLLLPKFRFHIVVGAATGTLFYFLNEFICPHGTQTLGKKLGVYGITGGILASTLYVPTSFVYGAFFGAILGLYQDEKNQPKQYPRGFQANIKGFDQNIRQKALHDDHQLKMSQLYMRSHGQRQFVQLQ